MKDIFLLLLLVGIATISQAQEKDYWPNGKVKTIGDSNKDGIRIGKWQFFYENGQKEAEGRYVEGDGETTAAVRNGRNSAIGHENRGSLRDGIWMFYHDNGQLKDKVTYDKGCPNGKIERWHDNGQKSEETTYADCKPIGERKMWDSNGRLFFEVQTVGSGKTLEIEWYPNGQKKSEIPYRDGQQYGTVYRWYENGNKEEEVMMKNTRVHGRYRSWYENGKQQRAFFSINNVMSGDYKEWNENGILVCEYIEMTQEKKITVRTYWDNGNVKMQGYSLMPESLSIHQWNQTRHGQWTYWYQDGSVMKTENYENGRLTSTEMP